MKSKIPKEIKEIKAMKKSLKDGPVVEEAESDDSDEEEAKMFTLDREASFADISTITSI